jgi:hypothetical protein
VDAALILQLSISIIYGAAAEKSPAMAKPNCKDRCGDVSIPYPFGIEQGCYLHEDFAVRCKNNQASVMTGGQINSDLYSNVSGIDLLNGEVRIQSTVFWDCGNITDKKYVQQPEVLALPNSLKVSNTKNKFTAIGCATIANIVGNTDMGGTLDLNNLHYTSACASFCDSQNRISKSAECDGLGCCQTSVPAYLSAFRLGFYYDNQLITPYGRSFSPCSYAFVVEASSFKFDPSYALDSNFQDHDALPLVLDWSIGDETCEEAKKNSATYACRAKNSVCTNATNGSGYRCKCSQGNFEGNPYLDSGCQGQYASISRIIQFFFCPSLYCLVLSLIFCFVDALIYLFNRYQRVSISISVSLPW